MKKAGPHSIWKKKKNFKPRQYVAEFSIGFPSNDSQPEKMMPRRFGAKKEKKTRSQSIERVFKY